MRKLQLRNKKLKLNTDLAKHKSGIILTVQSKGGVLVDKYWRDRLKDSEIDGCVTLLEDEPKAKVKTKIQDEPKTEGKV